MIRTVRNTQKLYKNYFNFSTIMAGEIQVPKTMKAWQYSSTSGGIETHLKINEAANVPQAKSNQHLVKVLAAALNPVDYKPAEVALIHRLAIPKPATPGIDFVGRVIKPAQGSALKAGQLVFGAAGASPLAAGALAEYAAVPSKQALPVPEGLSAVDAASVPVAGLTAYQTIIPYTKPGSRVFINGGSGGTGIFGIQIAKAHGCHVTTSCSTPNVALCKSLGADEVIDYKQTPVLEALKKIQPPFDHVVDNVGSDRDLFWHAHEYTTPAAVFMNVAGSPTLSYVSFSTKAKLLPGFLGGGKRTYSGFLTQARPEDLEQIAKWMVEGKVKAVIDTTYPFEGGADAFKKLKSGRSRGKLVIDVALNKEDA